MIAIGLDVHQRRTSLALLDTETGLMEDQQVPSEELVEHLAQMIPAGTPCRVVLETGSGSALLARRLAAQGLEAVVVDAFKAHRHAEGLPGSAKTDRLDARALALLAASGPERQAVWVPEETLEDLRALTRVHRQLTEQGTRLRNQIRGLLRHDGLRCPFTDLMGRRAQQWLEEAAGRLSAAKACALRQLRLAMADNLARRRELSGALRQMAHECEAVQRLMTLPGCGLLLATALVAEIGDLERFPSARNLRSYSGLVPTVHQSGERRHTGPLVTRGNRFLRRALVLLAQHVACSKALRGTALTRTYYRHLHRHGPNPAKVALARKLCDILFAMWRDRTDFDLQRMVA
jgi:transposase